MLIISILLPRLTTKLLQITQCAVLLVCLVSQIGCNTTTPPITKPDLTTNTVTKPLPAPPPAAQPIPQQVTQPPRIVAVATSLLGLRYRYGGLSPEKGFDCSGFVYYSHRQIGIELPRTSSSQFTRTQPVARQNLSPGDLVFFRTRRGRINHVGIYLGQNRFIHAPGKGKVVSVTTLDNPYWQPRFARGGRLTL